MVGWPKGVLIKYLLHLSCCSVVACLYVCLPPKAVKPLKGQEYIFYISGFPVPSTEQTLSKCDLN